MGNICNGNFEKDDNTETVDTVNKNYTVCYFILKNKSKVQMILGNIKLN